MLRIRNSVLYVLTVKGWRPLVRVADLDVKSGHRVGLWGYSGVGKTALLTAVFRPWVKEISHMFRMDGEVAMSFQRVSYICQADVLFPFSSIRANILHLTNSRNLEDVKEILPARYADLFLSRAGDSPMILSGGEKKALLIARALLREPDCVILDEAFAALDLESRQHLAEIIISYSSRRDASVFVVSHQIEDLVVLADRILPMRGKGPSEMGMEVDMDEIRQGSAEMKDRVATLYVRLGANREIC